MVSLTVTVEAVRATRSARRLRTTRVVTALSAIVVALFALGLSLGDYTIAIPDIVAALLGQAGGGETFVVTRLRLPRVVLGALVGAALGVAGAMFQSVLRNPIASPDIIGITSGASAAALAAMIVWGATGISLALAAFVGALGVATVIYLLARRGGVSGYRFALVGIALAFMAWAVINYLLTRSDVKEAQSALVWLVGSIGSPTWDEVAMIAIAIAALLPAAAALSRRLGMMQLGDDTATALGVPTERSRVLVLGIAVALAAVATAATGPIGFVAFLAGPIARRLVGGGRSALAPAALVGVITVLAADLIGQHVLSATTTVPVGIVTGAVGAPYLLWLLASTNRRERGA